MMALGTIYPIGLVIQGAIAGAVGIGAVTVASGVLLFAVMAGLTALRPGLFRALEDDKVTPSDAGTVRSLPVSGR